jgi:hypothetical protein
LKSKDETLRQLSEVIAHSAAEQTTAVGGVSSETDGQNLHHFDEKSPSDSVTKEAQEPVTEIIPGNKAVTTTPKKRGYSPSKLKFKSPYESRKLTSRAIEESMQSISVAGIFEGIERVDYTLIPTRATTESKDPYHNTNFDSDYSPEFIEEAKELGNCIVRLFNKIVETYALTTLGFNQHDSTLISIRRLKSTLQAMQIIDGKIFASQEADLIFNYFDI